jgi:hypothetical protein
MGCKAAVACNNNKKNNCNKELDPSDEAGWVQDHENVGIADFSSFCDMHFWNDKNFAEKKSETGSNLGKRKWQKRDENLADWIFGETETEFDENAEMQVDFVG